MTNFSDLALTDDKIEGVDYDNVGEERGAFTPNLPEGDYEFQLPKNLAGLWEISASQKGQRVRLQFSNDEPLRVSNSRVPELIGSAWTGSISNVERNRARKGEPDRLVSDLGLFVRNALKDSTKISGQKELMALVNKHGGEKFVANNEWSAYCNQKKVRYVTDETGHSVEDPEGKQGCGANYYSSGLPRNADGSKADRLTCACGAALMARGNLARFRPAQR